MDFYKELTRAFLKDAYKLSDQELDSLINESDTQASLSALLGKDQDRVSTIKKPFEGKFEQGKAAGFKEGAQSVEKAVKSTFGIESDLQGSELVNHVKSEIDNAAPVNPKAKELTDDDVKRHPVYQAAEKAAKLDKQKTVEEWEGKYNTREQEIKDEAVFADVAKQAILARNKANPIIPGTASVASTHEETFLNRLKQNYKWQRNEDGSLVPMDKNGKVIEDGHGRTVEPDKLFLQEAGNVYEFAKNNGGTNAGNTNTGNNQSGAGGRKPKNQAEHDAIMADKTIPADERINISREFEKSLALGTES